MKPSVLLCLWSLIAPLVTFAQSDLSGDEKTPPAVTRSAPAGIGRFQIAEIGNYQLLLDTATGRVWQVSRRGGRLVLEPVLYEHPEGEAQPLPDFEPEFRPTPDLYLPDPELEAKREARAQEFVTDVVSNSIIGYATTMGRFPPNLAALTANLNNDPAWQGPYLRASPIDPWGNRYRYRFPGERNPETYDVWSLGPDGKESADDIGNW